MNNVRIRPPVLAGLYLFVALGLHYFFPRTRIVYSPYRFLGIIILGAGVALTAWALRLFKKKGTTHDPHGTPSALVTTGLFRYSRNPMYLGVCVLLLGVAILVGTIPLFLAPIAFFVTMNAVFIPREEKILERIFGQEYLRYKNRVRRWL